MRNLRVATQSQQQRRIQHWGQRQMGDHKVNLEHPSTSGMQENASCGDGQNPSSFQALPTRTSTPYGGEASVRSEGGKGDDDDMLAQFSRYAINSVNEGQQEMSAMDVAALLLTHDRADTVSRGLQLLNTWQGSGPATCVLVGMLESIADTVASKWGSALGTWKRFRATATQ